MAKFTSRRDIQQVIDQIAYKPGWSFIVGDDGQARFYLQVSVSTESELSLDSVARDGSRQAWKGGKHFLSPHMCLQEVVGVAFKAIRDAEEHEMREWFRYRGASIYNPHLNPDVLAIVAKRKDSFVVRDNAMSMEEPT